MPNCVVVNCKNSSRQVGLTSGNVSYHRFPRDPYVKEKWIDATGNKNWFPSKYSTICSIHFKDDDYTPSKRRKLFDNAYPTVEILKIPNSEEVIINQQGNTSTKITSMEENLEITKLHKLIKYKNLKIKRLQEQNRRKFLKIISLKKIIECLQNDVEEQTETGCNKGSIFKTDKKS